MFKIVDYDYYIKAAKSIYVLSKNLKSVWNRGWLWLPCISAGNHDKTHKISLNVGPSSEEQWGQVSRDQAESDVITATAQLQPSSSPAENICSQLKCSKTETIGCKEN